ncbi:ABC transporter permease [Pseudactinotalea terrae]|uniref:ABC transporter permease n=1 Tax=Pseudactinotalea terrae TaxID=1743262 RepID=UPI0012E14CFE|nr:ABC transporter permease [Pseudactinotalea terrae]
MTTTATSPAPAQERGSALRRITALARLELTMLIRNKTALFNALTLGPLMVVVINSFQMPGMDSDRTGVVTTLVASLVVFALVFAGYYNLCTTAVARREELMLKRLTIGEVQRWEVLVAMAAPALFVILAQVLLGGVAISVLVGAPAMVNPLLVVLGLLLGFTALAALGYATATITRTVEAAQITTLLPLAVLIFFSGSTFPFALMPDGLRTAAELTPLAAANQLMTLGLSGTAADGSTYDFVQAFVAGLQPTIVLLAWIAIGGYLVQRMMPWEPRR